MKNLDELREVRDEVRKGLDLRSGTYRAKIVVGMGTCGIADGARKIIKALMEALEQAGIYDVAVTASECAGFCEQEPLVDVEMPGQPPVRYGKVDVAAIKRIVTDHIVGGKPVESLVFV